MSSARTRPLIRSISAGSGPCCEETRDQRVERGLGLGGVDAGLRHHGDAEALPVEPGVGVEGAGAEGDPVRAHEVARHDRGDPVAAEEVGEDGEGRRLLLVAGAALRREIEPGELGHGDARVMHLDPRRRRAAAPAAAARRDARRRRDRSEVLLGQPPDVVGVDVAGDDQDGVVRGVVGAVEAPSRPSRVRPRSRASEPMVGRPSGLFG